MKIRIFITLALTLIGIMGFSQVSFHRLYETALNDTIFYHMNSTTTNGEVITVGTRKFEAENQALVFSVHDMKGNIKWSKQLDFGRDTVEIVGVAKLSVNEALDSILFVVDATVNGDASEFFGKISIDGGENAFVKKVGGNQFATFESAPQIATFFKGSNILCTSGTRPTLSRIGPADDLKWSKTYTFENQNGDSKIVELVDIKTTQDSMILTLGTVGEFVDRSFLVTRLDSIGNQVWSNEYTFETTDAFVNSILPYEIVSLNDGFVAIVGQYDVDFAAPTLGFIALIDTIGRLTMVKNFNLNDPTLPIIDRYTSIRNIIEGKDGSLWCSGIYSKKDTSQYFTTNFNRDGSINWTTVYNGQMTAHETNFSEEVFSTSLLPVKSTGGGVLVGHGFKDGMHVLNVMKHDASGVAMCSDTIPSNTQELVFSQDTIIVGFENGGIFFNDFETEYTIYDGFSPPVLNITQLAPFCPNEVIDTILVASTGLEDDVVSYLWSTEETNDTINITEEGEYSVTVTITEDVCYTMCDTVEVTRLSLPMVIIAEDNTQFCSESTVRLNLNYQPGAMVQSILWSTLETSDFIDVDTEGSYSVTIIDACGEQATASVNVIFPIIQPPTLELTPSSAAVACSNDGYVLTASYQGSGGSVDFKWSTGEAESIFVSSGFAISRIDVSTEMLSTNATYMVTITDDCGEEKTATVTLEPYNLLTEVDVVANPNCDVDPPFVIFSAVDGEGNVLSSEEVTLEININNVNVQQNNPTQELPLSTYYVIAKNCKEDVIFEDSIFAFNYCGVFKYPLAFFPTGDEENELTFGPLSFDLDLSTISEFDFKVFNRWGQTVFETNDVNQKWNGMFDSERASAEVYMWYVSYVIDGKQLLDKGDITLIR
ncbi:MAG: gliding motility-associated C-terminal domain-containing protein [Saprospiraceae bacterium]